jgi:hypothetical protein
MIGDVTRKSLTESGVIGDPRDGILAPSRHSYPVGRIADEVGMVTPV